MTRELVAEDIGAETRRREVSALRGVPGAEVVEKLVEALGDVDWRVRKEAVQVGAAHPERISLIPRLVDLVANTDNVGQRNASLELFGLLGEVALEALVDSMNHVPANSRKFVVAAIGEAGRHEDVLVLERMLTDDDPNVAAAALEAIGRIGGADAERVLRGTLASADPFARVAGLDGLERLRARVPFRELEPHLHERLTRKVALQLAGRSGDVAAVPTVTEALSDGVPHVASAAAVALTRLYDDGGACAEAVLAETEVLGASAREILLSTLSHGDPVARQAACRLLVLAREPKAVDGVVDLAAKDSITARELMALSRWGTDVVSLLLAASDRHRGRVRGVALELAAYLAHGPDVAPPTGELSDELRRRIREAVQSSDPDARLAGVRSMLQWGEAEDAALLTAAAKVGPGEVSRAAGQALEALADRHQSAVRESLVPVELDGPGGAALTSLVAKLAEGDVVGRLRAALSSEDAEIRRSAVEALAIVGGADAAEAVGVALTDEDPDVQATAAQVLGRLRDANGHSVGVDKLLVALEAEDSTVRAAAARALGQTKEPRAEEPLRALLDGEEPFVVGAALEGLRLLGKPAVLERIDAFLIHPDEEVAKQALWLVSEIDTGMRISRLAQGLGHAAWDVRQLAAMLLGETRSEEALASLRAKLPEEDYDLVRDAILDAITVLESTR